jgi:hypothetical protein
MDVIFMDRPRKVPPVGRAARTRRVNELGLFGVRRAVIAMSPPEADDEAISSYLHAGPKLIFAMDQTLSSVSAFLPAATSIHQ